MKTANKSHKKSSNINPDKGPSLRRSKSEQPLDEEPLSQDLSEEYRDTSTSDSNLSEVKDTSYNDSQAQDRSEDLAEGRDPFMQDPQVNDIPPELIQERAYQLYEQRGGSPQEDLADWFEAERQLRGERAEKL